ncbi:TIGR02186 family protein [Pelagibacteraceae bacterium]|nr:TIGR02186 family protein [Pelagibacteraceae bacterium]
MIFLNKHFAIFFVIIIFLCEGIKAEEVYFDLSEDNIEIKTDFDGKEIIIFGLLQDDHETLLTIKGPPSKMKIQKKERYFGVWINNKQITYSKIPTLFFLSSSSNIDEILPKSIQTNNDLNFDKILNNKTFDQNFIFENDQSTWNENFVRIKKKQQFYKEFEMKIFKEKLFQTSVFFPPNTIPGIYNVDIYYIKHNAIINNDKKQIIVKKTGVGSEIYEFAKSNAATYGVLVIIFSILSGLIAATLFRRV